MAEPTNVTDICAADATVWDLAALRQHFGHSYEIWHISLTWYAWPHDGHLTRAITARTGEGLRAEVIKDRASPRPRIPHQRTSLQEKTIMAAKGVAAGRQAE